MPPNIEEIFNYTTEDGGKEGVLGIDTEGQLYWNGHQVITEQKLTLNWWVNLSAVVTGFSTAAIAVFTALMYFRAG